MGEGRCGQGEGRWEKGEVKSEKEEGTDSSHLLRFSLLTSPFSLFKAFYAGTNFRAAELMQ